jgi:hypothetical protein
MHASSTPEKPRREYSGVVEHQQLVAMKRVSYFDEPAVLQTSRCAIHKKHAGSVSAGERSLSDELSREQVFEV